MAAILNFKMADIGTIEKNGTKANFVPWTIMIKKNLGSKNVAEFLAKYITAYTIMWEVGLQKYGTWGFTVGLESSYFVWK